MKELIFGLIGGTALLMYGVDKMGEGLEKASGEMMKKILTVLTGKVWSAFLVGIVVTVLVQSSTAITVLTVGFVNAGLMRLPQAVGIIYGANIGTTITAQLMAFSFHFKLTDIALPVLGIGFAVSYFAKNRTIKNIGEAMMGFGMMFLGLKILNGGVPFMKNSETMRFFFAHYASIPIVGIMLGALATALVHSSSATVGLVMVLGQAGLVDLTTAVCIMLGDNIGTCITAQLASMTGNIHARRTAWAHSLYNIFGVVLFGLFLPIFVNLIESFTVWIGQGNAISPQIANSHTVFNILSAIIFLPMTKYYVKFLETFIRPKTGETNRTVYLDKLLLDTPVAALSASLAEIVRGAEMVKEMISRVMETFVVHDEKIVEKLNKDEDIVDELQKDITTYMIDVSKRPLSDSESSMIPVIINTINNVERIGDRTMDILELSVTKHQRNLSFTSEAIRELEELQSKVICMLDTTLHVLRHKDHNLVTTIAELEDQIDEMSKNLQQNHLSRLDAGICNVESGVVYIDVVNHFERIADHIYKIALMTQEGLQGLERTQVQEIEAFAH